MKGIARTHTKRLAAVRALPLVAIEHSTDVSDGAVQKEVPLAEAWAYFDRWGYIRLIDAQNGSYRIGTEYVTCYDLFPEGHERLLQYRAMFARTAEFEARQKAAEQLHRFDALLDQTVGVSA